MFRSSQNLKALVREASSRNLVSWMMAMLMRMLFSGYFFVSAVPVPAFIFPASFSYKIPWYSFACAKSGGKQIMVPFSCQEFCQNFQIPRHIKSLNVCMKH
jgi:hypothetical protein